MGFGFNPFAGWPGSSGRQNQNTHVVVNIPHPPTQPHYPPPWWAHPPHGYGQPPNMPYPGPPQHMPYPGQPPHMPYPGPPQNSITPPAYPDQPQNNMPPPAYPIQPQNIMPPSVPPPDQPQNPKTTWWERLTRRGTPGQAPQPQPEIPVTIDPPSQGPQIQPEIPVTIDPSGQGPPIQPEIPVTIDPSSQDPQTRQENSATIYPPRFRRFTRTKRFRIPTQPPPPFPDPPTAETPPNPAKPESSEEQTAELVANTVQQEAAILEEMVEIKRQTDQNNQQEAELARLIQQLLQELRATNKPGAYTPGAPTAPPWTPAAR